MAKNILPNLERLIQFEKIRNRPFKPIIISDIDGVLVRGGTPISGTLEALRKIHQHQIPFACLTNGGGQLQSSKARKLNQLFGQQLFTGQFMFMNHTPLKPKLVEYSKKKGNLLILGSLNVKEIVEDLGIRNYVTADELWSIYMQPDSQNQNLYAFQSDLVLHQRTFRHSETRIEVKRRLGRDLGTFEEEGLNINSIFALNDVSPYETAIRVIHNILQVKSQLDKKVQISYYAAQNDIVWASAYARPRIAFGPFNYILENHCRKHKFKLLEHVYYGKPQRKVFNFVETEMRKEENEGVFFMVGDNPKADIRGANSVNWYSFLTKTGIHRGNTNDKNDPATFLAENFEQVVETILEAKKLLI